MHACRTLARAFNARTNALRHSATMPKNKRGGGKGGGAGPHHHHRGSKKTKSSSGARFHAAAATASGGGDAPAPPPAQDDALAAFTKWSIDRGFELHPNVSLVNDAAAVAGGAGGDGDGGGRHNAVYAVGAIAPGDALAVIPKAWCLTPSNSSISLVVPMDDLDDLEDAALVLAVMYERAMGEKSPWYPYFSILPSSEDLPCLWTDDKAEAWLEGTDVLSRIENDEPAMRYDHERIMETCRAHESSLRHFFPDKKAPAKVPADDDDDDDDDDETRSTKSAKSDDVDDEEGNGPRLVERRDGPAGYDAFLSAASIVASRAFHVDDEQGQGLVPIADLFNHAGGGREHVHFTGGKEPTPGLGYLTKIDPPVDARDPRAPPSGATPPPATYEEGNTDPGVNEIAGLRSTRDVDGVLTIDAVRAAGAGDELFNTFGDHGNALLLHKYGFCEWDNARGGVMIPREVLIGVLGEDVLDDAEDLLDDHDYDSDADSEDAEDADEDMTSAGAAAAKAAGWSGGAYDVDADGGLSRDLLLVLTVACTDPDDASATDATTKLPIAITKSEDELLASNESVTEAALAVIEARGAALPEGDVESDLEAARKAHGPLKPAGRGCVGEAAACVVRACERATLERAFVRVVDVAKRAKNGGGGGGKGIKGNKVTGVATGVPLQDTPYGPVVYVPRRNSTGPGTPGGGGGGDDA